MHWQLSWRADPAARALADRHYNRQSVGAAQFVPPGRCLVLTTPCERAFWVTSWPHAAYVKHAWAGAWVCSAFRREDGAPPASELIRDAIAATKAYFRDVPFVGMVTFIDRDQVKPIMVRGAPVWGWTWRKVGFEEAGETVGGLLALVLPPERMPMARQALPGGPLFAKDAS